MKLFKKALIKVPKKNFENNKNNHLKKNWFNKNLYSLQKLKKTISPIFNYNLNYNK
jgi:hypothetical protein